MASERMEWVEIIEPKTKEHMYANLTTGECVWDPPPGVPVKKTDNNQWWELFDQSTSRFYYYNATSQKTVWHRPTDCDIIPLAKLQTLKQNTEPASSGGGVGTDSLRCNAEQQQPKRKETVSTQTQTPTMGIHKPHSPGAMVDLQTSPPSPSPSSRRHHHHHHHHNNRHHHRRGDPPPPSSPQQHPQPQQPPPQPPQQPPPPRRHHNHSQDSGRSSDSSVSHSRTSLESGSYRLLDSPHRQQPPPPHRSPNQPPPVQPRGTIDSARGKGGTLEANKNQKSQPPSEPPPVLGMSMSTSTPLFKKKNFAEPQREPRRDVNLDFESKSKNGLRNSEFREVLEAALRGRVQQMEAGTTSPYRESPNPTVRHHDTSPYRPPDPQPPPPHPYKAQGPDKYRSLAGESGSSGRYQRGDAHRDRVNSLDKSNPPYYSGSVRGKQQQQTSIDNTGSVGRRHHGCSVSLSDANVREMYGAMMAERNDPAKNLSVRGSSQGTGSNVAKQRSFDVVAERDSTRAERDKEFRRAATCNNSVDNSQQQLSRSYSFVQQQKQQQQQQQQHKLNKQSSRRRDHDDDSMHERYLMPQNLEPQAQPRLNSSNSSSSSAGSNDDGSLSSGSQSGDPGDDDDDVVPAPLHHVDDPKKKQRSNGHPSPPSSPYYGNLLDNADHLLPLQHYILQQAKLSGCYKFGDPLLAEEGDDSLDEEGGRDAEHHRRDDDDSDDQFADDEAASNQGDSSSQEYLEDHYADLGNYDTAGLATYYNTADTLTRPQATPPPPPNIASQAEARENIIATRPISLPTPTAVTGRSGGGGGLGGFALSGLGTCVDTADYDEARKDDGSGDIEKYAQDNLNLNCGKPKGLRQLFRKKFSVREILSWSKDPIPQPMLVVVDGEKLLKREACNLFRLVQVYMGDRKANVGMTLDSVAMEIVNTVYSKPALRDELYVQICRQTTENPRKESLRRGWELMAVCLAFVPPSATFEPYLEGYMNRHRDPNFQFPEVAKWPIHVQVSHYATVACKRLQRIGAHGKRQPRKATTEDIDQARLQIFRASMFGATLSEVMALQRDRFPQRELPWIQTTLTRQVLIRGGTMTEGIFRVSADADEVNVLKCRLDKFEDGAILAASQDAHAPASLLKLWVRELYEPLIPDSFYAECVNMRHDDPEVSAANVAAVVERLPELNRRVLCHLIHFLQIFARPDVVARTKMDASNLAMVMAPNILRCTSQDPRVILENARKEMAFVRTMIETLETAWVEDLH